MAPMTAREVAEALGITTDTFYRRRKHYVEHDRMPAPITDSRRPRWERVGMQLWLARHSPLAPAMPANDAVRIAPVTIDDQQRELHAYYESHSR